VSQDLIGTHLRSSLAALERTTRDVTLIATIRRIAVAIITALNAGNKILVIGNGGSAADAQHIAAEIVGRYKQDRPAYSAIALTTDTSALTAISNDYGFEWVFARQVEGLGRRGDVLLVLTTSGRSPSILKALTTARSLGIVTIGFTGTQGEAMGPLCDDLLIAPSDDTPIIQQIHLVIGHAICEAIEHTMMQLAASRASIARPASP
jgi:D-sedoheptulose 7-phosphate isomerase